MEGRPVDVTISTPAGAMPGYVSRPGGDGRWPGVVVLHDGFGIDGAVRAQADWLAGAGYLALSADLGSWGRGGRRRACCGCSVTCGPAGATPSARSS
jgi:dienelactone hydrolase